MTPTEQLCYLQGVGHNYIDFYGQNRITPLPVREAILEACGHQLDPLSVEAANAKIDGQPWQEIVANFQTTKFCDPSIQLRFPQTLLGQKFFWKILNKKNSEILSYNITGFKKLDLFKVWLKFSNIALSYKSIHTQYDYSSKKRNFKLLYENYDNEELEKAIVSFIEQNLPVTLYENFDLLLSQAKDFKNKKIGVASPGFYIDEQLIELELIKENGGKIIQIQEGGNALDKYSSSSKSSPYSLPDTPGFKITNFSKYTICSSCLVV